MPTNINPNRTLPCVFCVRGSLLYTEMYSLCGNGSLEIAPTHAHYNSYDYNTSVNRDLNFAGNASFSYCPFQ